MFEETSSKDGYGHTIVTGQSYIIGNFLERSASNSKGYYFKVDSKTSYLHHESFMYHFAQFSEKKNEFFIGSSDYFELLTLLSIQEWHPYLLFDHFIYTILQFTGFLHIYSYSLIIVNIFLIYNKCRW